jgi:hypothetical protein
METGLRLKYVLNFCTFEFEASFQSDFCEFFKGYIMLFVHLQGRGINQEGNVK